MNWVFAFFLTLHVPGYMELIALHLANWAFFFTWLRRCCVLSFVRCGQVNFPAVTRDFATILGP